MMQKWMIHEIKIRKKIIGMETPDCIDRYEIL